MTLTKKEFLAAVKLCSDAAVHRGLPNMRLKAAKSKVQVQSPSKKGFQPPKPDPRESSPYMSKLLGKIMGKRKGPATEVPKVSIFQTLVTWTILSFTEKAFDQICWRKVFQSLCLFMSVLCTQ